MLSHRQQGLSVIFWYSLDKSDSCLSKSASSFSSSSHQAEPTSVEAFFFASSFLFSPKGFISSEILFHSGSHFSFTNLFASFSISSQTFLYKSDLSNSSTALAIVDISCPKKLIKSLQVTEATVVWSHWSIKRHSFTLTHFIFCFFTHF